MLNLFENLKISKINVINKKYENRFLNNDVEFFNFFYDNKFNNIKTKMKYVKKKRIFVICLYLSIELKTLLKLKMQNFFETIFKFIYIKKY